MSPLDVRLCASRNCADRFVRRDEFKKQDNYVSGILLGYGEATYGRL